jgi:hypothetical protein
MTIPSTTVHPDRRTFLGGALVAPLLQGAGSPAPVPAPRTGPLMLAEVLAGSLALLREQVLTGEPNEEAWVHGAAALFARLDAVPPDPFGAMTERERGFLAERGWTFRRADGVPADRSRPAVITHQIHVPANGAIPLHDHRQLFGAVLVAAGELEIRSFDVVDGDASTPQVVLQQTSRCWLRPGRFALLTRTRDHVHEFRAGAAGARVLDLFAWLDASAATHDLTWVDDADAPRADRRWRARWA